MVEEKSPQPATHRYAAWLKVVALVVIMAASWFLAQLLLVGVMKLLALAGVVWNINSTVENLSLRVAMYALMIAMLLGVIRYRYGNISLKDIGLQRLLEWKDIGLSLAGAVLYFLLAALALAAARLIPAFNATQTQDVGVATLLYGNDLSLAFFILVVFTPICEEVIFRGFFYGRLRRFKKIPWWLSAIIVSILFGIAHGQWNVGIDVFCLSMVTCALYELTGSIWAGIMLHMIKNSLAFIVTFVLPHS